MLVDEESEELIDSWLTSWSDHLSVGDKWWRLLLRSPEVDLGMCEAVRQHYDKATPTTEMLWRGELMDMNTLCSGYPQYISTNVGNVRDFTWHSGYPQRSS